jgi:hypothetical protein
MATARILSLTLEPESTSTYFNLQFSADGGTTWTNFDPANASPAAPVDIAVSELSSNVYTLDGVNSPGGNDAAASYLGNLYRYRLKNTNGYGNWSQPFRADAYPSPEELQAYLTAHGLTLTSGQQAQCAGSLAAAIADFERQTGRKPLYSTSSTAKTYDPPTFFEGGRSVLWLGRDLASVSSISYQPEDATAETLTAGEDYDLLGYDERDTDVDGPYDRIAFYRRWTSPLPCTLRGSLTITGVWAYSSTGLPDDVFQALLARGAWGMWTAPWITAWRPGRVSRRPGRRSIRLPSPSIAGWCSNAAASRFRPLPARLHRLPEDGGPGNQYGRVHRLHGRTAECRHPLLLPDRGERQEPAGVRAG